MNIYLRYSQGQLFEQSREQKEGYETFKLIDGTESKNFRKYYESITGKFTGIRRKEAKGDFGDAFIFFFEGEKDTYWVEFNVTTSKGTMNPSLMSFTENLKTMKVGTEYRLWPFKTEPSEQYKRSIDGISVSEVLPSGDLRKFGREDKFSRTYRDRETNEVTEGDIPEIKFSYRETTKKWSVDQEEAEDFLIGAINAFIESQPEYKKEQTSSPKENTVAEPEPATTEGKPKKKYPF